MHWLSAIPFRYRPAQRNTYLIFDYAHALGQVFDGGNEDVMSLDKAPIAGALNSGECQAGFAD